MRACGSGLADCVQLLAQKRAVFTKLDASGRGCLQRAQNAQGKGQVLATWLLENVPDIPSTNAKGRDKAQKTTGQFSKQYRTETGPNHKGRKSKRESKGYQPQGDSQWQQRSSYSQWRQDRFRE